jgi:hypothetical protein
LLRAYPRSGGYGASDGLTPWWQISGFLEMARPPEATMSMRRLQMPRTWQSQHPEAQNALNEYRVQRARQANEEERTLQLEATITLTADELKALKELYWSKRCCA